MKTEVFAARSPWSKVEFLDLATPLTLRHDVKRERSSTIARSELTSRVLAMQFLESCMDNCRSLSNQSPFSLWQRLFL